MGNTTHGDDEVGATAGFGIDEVLRVADTAVNPFCAIDRTGTVLWAGGSIEELLGWSAAELRGRSMLEMVAPSSVADAVESLSAADDYVSSRSGEQTTWEGVGPVIELVCADGSTVRCSIAVATPVRTGLPGFVLQLRRADSDSALEEALVAMGRGDSLGAVLEKVASMLAGELPEVDVAVAHRCTPDDQLVAVGSPAGLRGIFETHALVGTPWQATVDDLDAISSDTVEALPEPLRTTAREAGYLWLTTVGVRSAGPGRHRAGLAVWSRHPYASHVFSHQRLRRCGGLVSLVIQWEEGRRALEWAASHDVLTGLPNRSTFVRHIDAEPPRGPDEVSAVLYLDLDDFKPVNDRHGHALGDRVLAEVARRLRYGVRPTDVVARLGGDEFAVLCPTIGTLQLAGALAARLVDAVAQPFDIDGVTVQVGLSVGVTALVEGDDHDGVLARADDALRLAKRSGKGRWMIDEDGGGP